MITIRLKPDTAFDFVDDACPDHDLDWRQDGDIVTMTEETLAAIKACGVDLSAVAAPGSDYGGVLSDQPAPPAEPPAPAEPEMAMEPRDYIGPVMLLAALLAGMCAGLLIGMDFQQ